MSFFDLESVIFYAFACTFQSTNLEMDSTLAFPFRKSK